MKKAVLYLGMLLGAAVGLLSALTDGVGVKIVMMSIGAVAGAAIGGAIARLGTERLSSDEAQESYGQGTSPEDRMRNFWRDKGKLVPFSGPADPEGDRHDFDRDRI